MVGYSVTMRVFELEKEDPHSMIHIPLWLLLGIA
jgi:hypothetical protein